MGVIDRVREMLAEPSLKRWLVPGSIGLGLVGVSVLTIVLLPTPKPDFEDDPIDEVFNFALLTNDFNRLPLEERLELTRMMVDRLKDLGGGESTLLAAFAAGIVGSAREQLEENAARIALDIWDSQAKGYANVPAEDRAAFLEQAAIEMTRLTEGLNGFPTDMTDDQILDRAGQQAQRDASMFRAAGERNSAAMGRFFTFMDQEIGGRASPVQRARITVLVRDMSRHFRGIDVASGD